MVRLPEYNLKQSNFGRRELDFLNISQNTATSEQQIVTKAGTDCLVNSFWSESQFWTIDNTNKRDICLPLLNELDLESAAILAALWGCVWHIGSMS